LTSFFWAESEPGGSVQASISRNGCALFSTVSARPGVVAYVADWPVASPLV